MLANKADKMDRKLKEKRVLWLRDNRGALTRIARKLAFSRGYVAEVYWGQKRSAEERIETELLRLGAPGFGTRSAPGFSDGAAAPSL